MGYTYPRQESSTNLLREIMSVMTPELKFKILAASCIALVFISGIGIGQTRKEFKDAEADSSYRDLGTFQYELGVHDKLLDRYGMKIESIDQRTIRLEASVDGINNKMAWFVGLFGVALVSVFTALGGTIYNRVIANRGQESPPFRSMK